MKNINESIEASTPNTHKQRPYILKLLLTAMVMMQPILSMNAQAMNSKLKNQQYQPLCVDLARRIMMEKISFYKNYLRLVQIKSMKSSARYSDQSRARKKFNDFPAIISSSVDLQMVKYILASDKVKTQARGFDKKLAAEENLINHLNNLLTQQGTQYLNSCIQHFAVSEKKCSGFIAKNFNQYNSCVNDLTSERSENVVALIPFLSYKNKLRNLASR